MKKDKIDLKFVEEMAAMGLFQQEIADALGIAIQTWYNYLKDPEMDVLEAYNRGRRTHQQEVFGGLRKHVQDRNPDILKFMAKIHFGRKENLDLTLSGNPDAPLEVVSTDIGSYAQMTSEERRARIRELEEKKKSLENK